MTSKGNTTIHYSADPMIPPILERRFSTHKTLEILVPDNKNPEIETTEPLSGGLHPSGIVDGKGIWQPPNKRLTKKKVIYQNSPPVVRSPVPESPNASGYEETSPGNIDCDEDSDTEVEEEEITIIPSPQDVCIVEREPYPLNLLSNRKRDIKDHDVQALPPSPPPTVRYPLYNVSKDEIIPPVIPKVCPHHPATCIHEHLCSPTPLSSPQ
jgi:hypothetical protein